MALMAGKLRHRIAIQQRTTDQDDYGQQLDQWDDVARVWADIEPLNGRELLAAAAVQAETTHTVTMRYRPGITPQLRINYNGRLFNILNVLDDNERHRTLTLLCSEGLNNG